MAIFPFHQVFTRHADGSLEPTRKVRIGAVTSGPGVRFGSRNFFGEIDISALVGCDIEAEEDGKTLVIKEFC